MTPVARAIADDERARPRQLQGSGVAGRVMKDDVLTVLERGRAGAAAAPAPAAPARTGAAARARTGAREERVKMTPLRKRVAERLLQAQNNAAILTTFNEVDMSRGDGAAQAVRREVPEAARREARAS